MAKEGPSVGEYQYQLSEHDKPHHSYSEERLLHSFLRNDDLEGLIALYRDYPRNRIGQMALDPVKNEEYAAVLAISMLVRVAMDEGLDPYYGYNLNDLYLQKVAAAHSIAQYRRIMLDAAAAIFEALRKDRSKNNRSLHVKRAKDYIQKNISKPLSVPIVAEALKISASRLSTVFSQTVGIGLAEYITLEKLEVAKDLLRFSEKAVAEIAHDLGFSTHSYFSMVFKKHEGITPAQFRAEDS